MNKSDAYIGSVFTGGVIKVYGGLEATVQDDEAEARIEDVLSATVEDDTLTVTCENSLESSVIDDIITTEACN